MLTVVKVPVNVSAVSTIGLRLAFTGIPKATTCQWLFDTYLKLINGTEGFINFSLFIKLVL
jgi:hypothetical protein